MLECRLSGELIMKNIIFINTDNYNLVIITIIFNNGC